MHTMINDGIYEQIVNEKLQKELDQLDMSYCVRFYWTGS